MKGHLKRNRMTQISASWHLPVRVETCSNYIHVRTVIVHTQSPLLHSPPQTQLSITCDSMPIVEEASGTEYTQYTCIIGNPISDGRMVRHAARMLATTVHNV